MTGGAQQARMQCPAVNVGSPFGDTERPRNELGTAKCLEGHLEMEIKTG